MLPSEPGVGSGQAPVLALAHRQPSGGRPRVIRKIGQWVGYSQLQPQTSTRFRYGSQYNREGQGALGFCKRCLRRKTKRGVATLGGAESYVRSLGALPGPKGAGAIPPCSTILGKVPLGSCCAFSLSNTTAPEIGVLLLSKRLASSDLQAFPVPFKIPSGLQTQLHEHTRMCLQEAQARPRPLLVPTDVQIHSCEWPALLLISAHALSHLEAA